MSKDPVVLEKPKDLAGDRVDSAGHTEVGEKIDDAAPLDERRAEFDPVARGRSDKIGRKAELSHLGAAAEKPLEEERPVTGIETEKPRFRIGRRVMGADQVDPLAHYHRCAGEGGSTWKRMRLIKRAITGSALHPDTGALAGKVEGDQNPRMVGPRAGAVPAPPVENDVEDVFGHRARITHIVEIGLLVAKKKAPVPE